MGLLIWGTATSASAYPLDRVVAVVNGEAITTSALADATPPGADPARILGRLITERLVLQRAKELAIRADPAELEAALSQVMQDNGIPNLAALEDALAQEGKSIADLRREIGNQMVRMQVMQRETAPRSPPDMETLQAYFQENAAAFAVGSTASIRQILFTGGDARQRAEALHATLDNETDYRVAEKRLSGTPEVIAGKVGTVSRDDLRQGLADALFALPPGGISTAIPGPQGVAIYLVDQRTQGIIPTFEAVLDDVRQRAANTTRIAAIQGWIENLKRGAHIEIRP